MVAMGARVSDDPVMQLRFVVIACSLVLLSSGTAAAQDYQQVTGRLPLPRADRPITLTEGTLRIDAAFVLGRGCITDLMTGTALCETSTGMVAGAGFGLLSALEVGAEVVPLVFSPRFDYGNPSAYVRLRPIQGPFELGIEGRVTFGTDDPLYDFRIEAAIPMRIHMSKGVLSLDVRPTMPIDIGRRGVAGDETIVGLRVPIELNINATRSFFFGPRSGFDIRDFSAASDELYIPFGVFVGYSIPGGRPTPVADIFASFDWPQFFAPGQDDKIFEDVWILQIGANIYIHFG